MKKEPMETNMRMAARPWKIWKETTRSSKQVERDNEKKKKDDDDDAADEARDEREEAGLGESADENEKVWREEKEAGVQRKIRRQA